MARLTAGARAALPASTFAIPGRFPIPDKSHARAALRDIPLAKGLKPGQASTIKRKAEAKLGNSSVFNPGEPGHSNAAGPAGAKPAVAKAIHNNQKALFGRMGGW